MLQFTTVMQLYQSSLAFLPRYQLLPGEDISSVAALTEARECIVGFLAPSGGAGVSNEAKYSNNKRWTKM